MLATADIFSFFNKKEKYEDVIELLGEQKLVEYLFFEVLFFVHDKT